jgi:hypothetical protein
VKENENVKKVTKLQSLRLIEVKTVKPSVNHDEPQPTHESSKKSTQGGDKKRRKVPYLDQQ